jgi:SWI/SNF-related matrix-associated actin-dependent regulator 1 of chromatin subfamily A
LLLTAIRRLQLLGINWLNLLFNRGLSCILADEMGESSPGLVRAMQHMLTRMTVLPQSGLGKTIQVIAFLAHIKEEDFLGPHLIIVPCVSVAPQE